MKQVCLVEPDCFAGYRMRRYCWSNLARSQVSCVLPLKLDSGAAAIIFDRARIGCLKNRLPRKVGAFAIVAHVHDLLLDKTLFDLRVEQLEDSPAVSDRRLATDGGSLGTVKPDFHGPIRRVRAFVMQRDALIGWILGGRIDFSTNFGARCRTFLVLEQLRRNEMDKFLELVD